MKCATQTKSTVMVKQLSEVQKHCNDHSNEAILSSPSSLTSLLKSVFQSLNLPLYQLLNKAAYRCSPKTKLDLSSAFLSLETKDAENCITSNA